MVNPSGPLPVQGGCNILVVDDQPEITALVAEALAEEGFNVRVAHDGAAALSAIRRDPPDLVLIDIAMPVMTGDQVLRLLRSEGFEQLPVIVMTADPVPERFTKVGASQYLRKPFDLGQLVQLVQWYVAV